MNEAENKLELNDYNDYDYDRRISTAIMSPFVILIIQYFVLMYFGLLGTSAGSITQSIFKLFVGAAYLYAFPAVFRRKSDLIIKVYFVAAFIFVGNYLFFRENRTHLISLVFPLFFMSLPSLIYTLSIRNFKILYKKMVYTSSIIFAVGTLIALLALMKILTIGSYSMALSYYMLIPSIIFLNEFFEKDKFRSLIVFLLSAGNIILLGARGPLLCIFIFMVIMIIKNFKKTKYETMKIYFIGIQLLIFFALYFNIILKKLYDFLLSVNINVRSINIFLNEGFYLSGRDRIYEKIIPGIIENPLLGFGIAGDRKILGPGVYAHNIFLEIIGNFGVIAGITILAIIIVLIVRSILSKSEMSSNISVIWFALGFVHLFLSSSYIIDIKFWIFLGIILRVGLNEINGKRSNII